MSRGDEGRERYSAGYDPIVIEALSERVLSEEAAFFIPHLEAGMSLLDCGCGPGVMTAELAQRVSPGEVVGVDRHGDQLSVGRARAHQLGVSNVRYEVGDIQALPFPDASFDAVFAHAVIYHLSDPISALVEIRRVLKPGGLVGIRDADFDRDVRAPTNPTLEQGFAIMSRVLEHSGAQLSFGRTQRAALRKAGFTDIVASASYDHFGTPDRVRGFSRYWVYFLTQLHRDQILEQGWATNDEIDAAADAFVEWGGHPDAFYARCRCEAVGRKGS